MKKVKKILAIDDQEEILFLLKWSLEEELNCEVHLASNGYHAINSMKKDDFDLVITDIDMPVMNGYEFILNSRQRLNFPKPIMVLSSNPPDPSKLKDLDVMISLKPLIVEDMLSKLRPLLR